MLFFVFQRGFYSYCMNEVFYDCTLCKQILLLLYTKKETAALIFSKPPFHRCMEMCLLCDGFFSFAVVRQINI